MFKAVRIVKSVVGFVILSGVSEVIGTEYHVYKGTIKRADATAAYKSYLLQHATIDAAVMAGWTLASGLLKHR